MSGYDDRHSNNDPSAVLAQLEAQGQLQGELQGQGQGQLNLQGQGQGQGEDQGQGQGQGEHQGQNQSSEDLNLNGNGNGNGNGNLNLNANESGAEGDGHGTGTGEGVGAGIGAGIGAGVGYGDATSNSDVKDTVNDRVDSANSNLNANLNASATDVHVNVDVAAHVDSGPPDMSHVLDLGDLSIDHLDGSFLVMPDFSTQTLGGDGNIFNLHEVNTLVSNGTVSDPSVGLSVGGAGGESYDPCDPCYDPSHAGGNINFNFSQNGTLSGINATAEGGNTGTGDASGSNSSSVAGVAQEAYTQHISLGANIQYNSMPVSVVGGDSISDLHHSTADHAPSV